jgi:hypothetical protein
MGYSFLSDIVVLVHFIYVIFAIVGGVLCIWWRKIIWLHIPAALWAAIISFAGWICPLTYLEDWFRFKGGGTGYSEGFIVKYIEPVLHPAGLTRRHQIGIGIIIVVLNLVIYGFVLSAGKRRLPREK